MKAMQQKSKALQYIVCFQNQSSASEGYKLEATTWGDSHLYLYSLILTDVHLSLHFLNGKITQFL